MSPLPPWLQSQLTELMRQKAHALLLAGPPGLGQYDLALSLARAWLCEQVTPEGACNTCTSCHAIDVRTHPDLCVLMPETLALELDWPLDEKTQDKIDKKELKPSKYIRVDATRQAVAFTQFTRSRGDLKVVLIYPADRLNVESANTLLKTLEEPVGSIRFILATEAAHALLPTIRSRCLTHHLQWPAHDQAYHWLRSTCSTDSSLKQLQDSDIETWLKASGGRPQEALEWLQMGVSAQVWANLPKALARGDFSLMSDWSPARQMEVLFKLCHDLMATQAGSSSRFFQASDMPPAPPFKALADWHKWLMEASRTLEHPFQAGLMQEAWAKRTQQALALH